MGDPRSLEPLENAGELPADADCGATDSLVPVIPRRRTPRWVWPPAALVVLSLGAMGYRLSHDDWQGLGRFRAGLAAPARTGFDSGAPAPASEAIPVAFSPVELPARTRLTARSALAGARGVHRRLSRPSATPGLPEQLVATASEPGGDEVDEAAGWDEIRREAAARRHRREELEALKPTLLEQQAEEFERASESKRERARRLAEADRKPFREELGRLMAELGLRAGPAIRAAALKHESETIPELRKEAERALRNWGGALDREGRIHLLRAVGLPEAMILDELAVSELHNAAARNGPRSEEEALVRAARLLLKVPIDSDRAARLSRTSPDRRRSVAGPR